ncbi:MAG: hypothetical protein ACREOH_06025, partial [Candidatus Entotheonellia bacterium]
ALIYVEVKRYPDPWPLDPTMPAFRSLVKSPPDVIPSGAARPRAMDIFSKLKEVPSQFPEGTVNLLFVFHRSVADAREVIQQALFGLSTYRTHIATPEEVDLSPDGLFALEAWSAVSGCCLCRVENAALVCPAIWGNPRASVPIPPQVRVLLEHFRPR